jgi:hypothetical protein
MNELFNISQPISLQDYVKLAEGTSSGSGCAGVKNIWYGTNNSRSKAKDELHTVVITQNIFHHVSLLCAFLCAIKKVEQVVAVSN